jgi:hypothetical protein
MLESQSMTTADIGLSAFVLGRDRQAIVRHQGSRNISVTVCFSSGQSLIVRSAWAVVKPNSERFWRIRNYISKRLFRTGSLPATDKFRSNADSRSVTSL